MRHHKPSKHKGLAFERPERPHRPKSAQELIFTPRNLKSDSPWIESPLQISQAAGFPEYLRRMRSPNAQTKAQETQDANKKNRILQAASEKADYRNRLKILNERTKRIAGNTQNYFEATVSWRIRVGGIKGPENILLPAFDALGMPYIPSSTLRGVARSQAIREEMNSNDLDWDTANQRVSQYFGDLKTKKCDQMGKIIFLDAYPVADDQNPGCGLTPDIVTNIWQHNGNDWNYKPNPNSFLSLKKTRFIIGVKASSSLKLSSLDDREVLNKVLSWLKKGLTRGAGAQINSGYGAFEIKGETSTLTPFLELDFELRGQLIHENHYYDTWDNINQDKPLARSEVRPIAFKSMLRYWFRTFARGQLDHDSIQVLESELFGGITPPNHGLLRVRISDSKIFEPETNRNQRSQQKSNPPEANARLNLFFSTENTRHDRQQLQTFFKTLAWLMFHLGGVGQGARRPYHLRSSTPLWRGSTLYSIPKDDFWNLPSDITAFQEIFQCNIRLFSNLLASLWGTQTRLRTLDCDTKDFQEAIDDNSTIIVCSGKRKHGKPYSLSILHDQKLKIRDSHNELSYNSRLCGSGGNPSPVWISVPNESLQVVTVFGASRQPRSRFIEMLQANTTPDNFKIIWPF